MFGWLRKLFFGSWRVKYFASAPGQYFDGATGRVRSAAAFFVIEENDKGEQRAFVEVEGLPREPATVARVLEAVGALTATAVARQPRRATCNICSKQAVFTKVAGRVDWWECSECGHQTEF